MLTKEQKIEALELSIVKWSAIVENGWDNYSEGLYTFLAKKFSQFDGNCPLCEMYSGRWDIDPKCYCDGEKCPLYDKTGLTCFGNGSPFKNWLTSQHKSRRQAEAKVILEILKEYLEKLKNEN